MSLVAVVAGKGAPGATTAATLLAAVWPRPAVFAECDPAGSDAVFRLRAGDGTALAGDRGVVSLVAASRVPNAAMNVLAHTQVADGGLPVLVGPASPMQAAAMTAVWPTVASTLADCDATDVIADCGRFTGEASTVAMVRSSRRVLVVCRATAASVAHTRSVLTLLNGAEVPHVPLSLLVVGEGDATVQVSAALRGFGELDVLGPLADDSGAAAGLAGRWTRRLDRSALVVSARVVARALEARLAEPAVPYPPGSPTGTAARVG